MIAAILAGVLTGTLVDRQAFAAFKSFDEAMAYNWKLTAWRAFQGAVIGAMAAYGIGVI